MMSPYRTPLVRRIRMGGLTLSRAPFQSPYVRAAQYAYSNRGKIYSAAKTIARTWRRSRSRRKASSRRKNLFGRSYVGESASNDTCKKCDNHNSDNSTLNAATLINVNLLNLNHTTINNIDSRQRDIVNVRGIKIVMEARNNLTSPVYFNIAILATKIGSSISNTEFFRDYSTERSINFGDASLGGLDYNRLPINTDRYQIMMHKRYRLRGYDLEAGTSYLNAGGVSYMNFTKYLKINKQVRYDGTSAFALTPVFLVFWCSKFLDEAPADNTISTMAYSLRTTIFFKEPK